MIYQYWWKILGVLLFIYILAWGLLMPLKPGIYDVSPSRFTSGDSVTFLIKAYNSNFLNETNKFRAFLKIDSLHLLLCQKHEALSSSEMNVSVQLPKFLPSKLSLVSASVIVDHPLEGSMIIPSKIILSQDSISIEEGKIAWTIGSRLGLTYRKSHEFPYRNILYETIRNTFYHVSLWFAMFVMFGMSVYHSIRFLKSNDVDHDLKSNALVVTGIAFGILGCITGSLWARYTWDAWWTQDIKLNMSALTMLIYFAYLILRASIDDIDRKRRISAAYNIFALVAVIPLIFVLPRLTDSLHPGNGGNPAFGSDDMDNALRIVFYPAVIAFTLIGLWIASLKYRIEKCDYLISEKLDENL